MKLGRRYLKTREYQWPKLIANKVAQFGISPNQISILSIVSSIIATTFLVSDFGNLKWLLAIFFIQFRLFCNMLDGLVAIEANRQSRLGDVFNEVPDRISDVIIILGFGYSLINFKNYSSDFITINLVTLSAILSLFTAYIRILFSSLGAHPDYCGPMAKQHRMALISGACLSCYICPIYTSNIIFTTLLVLNFGLLITITRRMKHGVSDLLCN